MKSGLHPLPGLVPLEHPWIDATRAPLYGINFPREATDDEVIGLCAAREQWAALAKYRVAWVVDLAGVVRATAETRIAVRVSITKMPKPGVSRKLIFVFCHSAKATAVEIECWVYHPA